MFKFFEVVITFSNVFAVVSPCRPFDEIIVCWLRSYSSAKYENASWKETKSWVQSDNSFWIFESSESNSLIYFAAFDW